MKCVRSTSVAGATNKVMATKVRFQIVSFCTSVQSLIDVQKLDGVKLLNAVNAALGELDSSESKIKAKAKVKLGGEDAPDLFKLAETIKTQYEGGLNAPLRLFYLDQELANLAKYVGLVELNGWPDYLAGWMAKFSQKENVPA